MTLSNHPQRNRTYTAILAVLALFLCIMLARGLFTIREIESLSASSLTNFSPYQRDVDTSRLLTLLDERGEPAKACELLARMTLQQLSMPTRDQSRLCFLFSRFIDLDRKNLLKKEQWLILNQKVIQALKTEMIAEANVESADVENFRLLRSRIEPFCRALERHNCLNESDELRKLLIDSASQRFGYEDSSVISYVAALADSYVRTERKELGLLTLLAAKQKLEHSIKANLTKDNSNFSEQVLLPRINSRIAEIKGEHEKQI